MPGVGALALGAVQFEQVTGAVAHRHGGVRHRLAEQVGEGFLALVVEVGLATEEDHLVVHQRLLDGLDRGGVQLAGELHATDLGADTAGHRVDLKRMNSGFNG